MVTSLWLASLLGCGGSPPPPPPPEACQVLAAPTPGPLAERRAAALDPAQKAWIFIEEGRRTGDPGFFTLADMARVCAFAQGGETEETRRLEASLDLRFHRFREAAALAEGLVAQSGVGADAALLSEARRMLGDLAGARAALEPALGAGDLEVLLAAGQLDWAQGDGEGAAARFAEAVAAGSEADPEPLARALSAQGRLASLRVQPAPALDQALALLPGYPPAALARGRLRLFLDDDAGAEADLRAAGRSVEALWALSELDPRADVLGACASDGVACGSWLADRDPDRALGLLRLELESRGDAVARIALAYAAFRAGEDRSEEIRAAVATGVAEPRALLQAGLALDDPALVARALASGAGLLPSERALAPPTR